MSNIEGMEEVLKEEEQGVGGRPPPVGKKRKTRKLTNLDFEDEEEDEDSEEEYKASEYVLWFKRTPDFSFWVFYQTFN